MDNLRPVDEAPGRGSSRRGRSKKVVPAKATRTSGNSRRLSLVLVLFGLLLHFVGIDQPREVVFDEVKNGKLISSYCCLRENVFDIEPPHGPMILGLASWVAGYRGSFIFQRIGQPYRETSPFSLRWFPALMGALLPLLFFMVLRQLGASRPIAFLGGVAVLLDNGFLLQSRLLTSDSLYWASSLFSVWLFLKALKKRGRERVFWMIGTGAMMGIALGTRLSGIFLPGLVAVVLLKPFLSRRDKTTFQFAAKPLAMIFAGLITTYFLGWVLHFSLLTNPGVGERFYRPTGQMVTDIVGVHERIFEARSQMSQKHQAASHWSLWPFMKKPIYYWSGNKSSIYLWGNPVVWLGSTFLFLFVVGFQLFSKITMLRILPTQSKPKPAVWVSATAAVLSMLPFVFSRGTFFLYQYFVPLLFVLATGLLWLEQAEWSTSSAVRAQKKSYFAVMGLIVVGFLCVLPVTFGLSVSESYLTQLVQWVRYFR